jgi:hypothetical protein
MVHRQDEVPVVAPKCCSFASKEMPDESSVRVRTWEGSAPPSSNVGRFGGPPRATVTVAKQ